MLPSLIAAIPIPAVLINSAERVSYVNDAASELIGDRIVGRHYVTALRQPSMLDSIETAFRLQAVCESEYISTEVSRETVWRALASPVNLEDGAGVLLTLEDKTAERDTEQIRRDFVGNVSHELRSPLTAMLGFIETLRGAARDDEAARDRFLIIMEREAERMNRLVRDLLSLSRVEAQERMRPTEGVDLAAILNSVETGLVFAAEEAGATIELHGVDEPSLVAGDEDQLLQVFMNLAENAVKYGRAGGTVRIVLNRHDNNPLLRGPSVVVSVSDEGRGIDPVHIPRLTERFYRVDSHRSREMGGTGLGLAIVKHIVNRHRGRLRIESKKGKGSTFVVVLPAHDLSLRNH